MLVGQMMDRPLLISSILDFANDIHPDSQIISVAVEGGIHRYSFRQARDRIIQLAHALIDIGVKPGDRVATLAWNGYRHYELYFAVSSIGAVCHTLNPRLAPDQMIYIVNHAQDRFLFADLTFLPILDKLHGHFPDAMQYVAMTDAAHMPETTALPNLACYEDLLDGRPQTIVWPELDENTAAGLCYTSGTTGNPKGALYSHRSNVLHSLFVLATDIGCFDPAGKILPVVPLFHANAWGLPYSTAISGTSLVFPGSALDGASLFDLMDSEQVFSAWGVPTVWIGLLGEMEKRGRKPDGLGQVIIGGSAAPGSMIDKFEIDFEVSVVHGWGMTELSPIGTLSTVEPPMRALPREELLQIKRRQGRRMFGVDLRIVDEDNVELPQDGEAFGELQVRGPGVVSGYFNDPQASADAMTPDGWFRTGDVATVSGDQYLSLVDRTKDLVKSGGEWISSIDLENLALGHPAIVECAVIAARHPKWDERPILIAVTGDGQSVTRDEIEEFLSDKVAKWQVPDAVILVEELPHTATGKVSKMTLRKHYGDYLIDNSG
jgi:acyl-CoA synthetase (AMP-forming)/AMP-acid ligase II